MNIHRKHFHKEAEKLVSLVGLEKCQAGQSGPKGSFLEIPAAAADEPKTDFRNTGAFEAKVGLLKDGILFCEGEAKKIGLEVLALFPIIMLPLVSALPIVIFPVETVVPIFILPVVIFPNKFPATVFDEAKIIFVVTFPLTRIDPVTSKLNAGARVFIPT